MDEIDAVMCELQSQLTGWMENAVRAQKQSDFSTTNIVDSYARHEQHVHVLLCPHQPRCSELQQYLSYPRTTVEWNAVHAADHQDCCGMERGPCCRPPRLLWNGTTSQHCSPSPISESHTEIFESTAAASQYQYGPPSRTCSPHTVAPMPEKSMQAMYRTPTSGVCVCLSVCGSNHTFVVFSALQNPPLHPFPSRF